MAMRTTTRCPDHEDPTKRCRFADVCEPRIQHVQMLLRHIGPLCWQFQRRKAQACYDPPKACEPETTRYTEKRNPFTEYGEDMHGGPTYIK